MRGDPNRNLVAAVCYLLGFVTGAVIFWVEPDDKFIRFHAMQSIMVTGALFILNIIVGIILAPLGILAVLSDLSGIVIWLVILAVCAISFVKAYQGQMFKWPIVGNFAEKRVS